jgi:hypothetical protein
LKRMRQPQGGEIPVGMSRSNAPRVKTRIARQERDHRKITFQDEFRLPLTSWNRILMSDFCGIEESRPGGAVDVFAEHAGLRFAPPGLSSLAPFGVH